MDSKKWERIDCENNCEKPWREKTARNRHDDKKWNNIARKHTTTEVTYYSNRRPVKS